MNNLPMVPRARVEQLLHYRLSDPFQDALQEYADYRQITLEEAFVDSRTMLEPERITSEVQILPVHLCALQVPHIFERLQLMLGFALTRSGSSFLDLGAGTGRDCLAFARSGKSVTHADVPWEGVAFARWRFAQRGLSARFVDVRDLPEERFDYIGCHDVFEHVEDPTALFVNFVLHLKPGGLLFVSLDLFNPLPTHLPKNDVYASFYDMLLRHLGLEVVMGHSSPIRDAACGAMRIYTRTRPVAASFVEERQTLQSEVHRFVTQELARLHSLLDAEQSRLAALA